MKRIRQLVSHVISLLSPSSPPQHEAPPGEHDLLQDDTVHGAPVPEPKQSVDKQRSRTALERQLREWRKPAQHLSHK